MSRREKTGRVVAELGRPETAEETAARKAENSRHHRMRQTVNNLVFSLMVTVGLVVVIVLAVPRGDVSSGPEITWSEVAQNAQPAYDETLADPVLPDGYSANYAEVRPAAGGGETWNIGLITPSDEFIGITQGFSADEAWVAGELANTPASTTTVIDGVTWTVYDNRDSRADVGNARYALVTEAGTSTFIVFGTADDAEFIDVAEAITPQITANEQTRHNTNSED
ncbi:hypothetical protein GCM10027416_10850 [Okibacterium endophyticum]